MKKPDEMMDQAICVAAIGGAWPKEALPLGLSIDDCETADANGGDVQPCRVWSIDLDGIELDQEVEGDEWKGKDADPQAVGMCPPQLAAALFRDGGLVWLAARPNIGEVSICAKESAPAEYGIKYAVFTGAAEDYDFLASDIFAFTGPTLLSAIDAAIRAITKGD